MMKATILSLCLFGIAAPFASAQYSTSGENKASSLQRILRLGVLFFFFLIHYSVVGQPLYKRTSGRAFITNYELVVQDTLEYKGHLFEVFQTATFYPECTEKTPGKNYWFDFIRFAPERWEGFTGYEREYAVLYGYLRSLDGFLPGRDAEFLCDTIPMQKWKFNYKKTFRLYKDAPGEEGPIYVIREMNVDLKEMKKNKVKVTFSTKKSLEKEACYDMLERRYYKGPKKGRW